MTEKDANKLHDSSAGDDDVKGQEDPGQVHCFELRSEPKVDNDVFVQLAPDVQDGEYQGIHKEHDVHEEANDHSADPDEHQHECVVCRSASENARF